MISREDGTHALQPDDDFLRPLLQRVAALAERYVQGVSTRNVKAISEELCGYEFSADALSPIHQKLDEDSPYRILDARYEKVRAVPGDATAVRTTKVKTGASHLTSHFPSHSGGRNGRTITPAQLLNLTDTNAADDSRRPRCALCPNRFQLSTPTV